MGCQKSKPTSELQKKQLVVATLNYCGIMNNPFEFYCQDFEKQLGQISTILEELLPRYFRNYKKETFKWEMGKLDVKVRLGRYSPVFSQDAGIQNQRFVTVERFRQVWDQVFNEQQKKIGQKFTNEERENTKLYDLICFHTLLKFVYNLDNFEELIKQNTAPYRKKLKPFFDLSFLDQKKKLEIMIKNFEEMQTDIFFTQEFSKQFEDYIDSNQNYVKAVDGTKDTMIVARKSSFRDMKYIQTVLTKEQIDIFNMAGRTSFLCLDNLIMINLHFTSKPAKNKPQVQQLRNALIKFRNARKKYDIIVAGDLNSFMPLTEDLKGAYQMFPDNQRQITTAKKRTLTQTQFSKANLFVQDSKDKIITSLKMKNRMIQHIDRTQANKDELLPKNNHPFDHFVVVVHIYK